MEARSARFPRRELLVALAGFGSVGAFTCQDEALMASRLARRGVRDRGIPDILVAAFGESGPSTEMAASV